MTARYRLLAVAPTVAALLAACGDAPPPSAELFPLEPGYRWSYRQAIEMEGGNVDASTLVLHTLPSEDYEGRPAFRRHSDDGVDYWLRRDTSGIYRVAMRHELQAEAQKDTPVRFVLKEPVALGTQWQATTVAYLLERRQGFPPELRHENKPVAMTYQVEALKENVSVPAGSFQACVKVRGNATLRLYADAVNGWKDLPLTTLEWYCPGAGLVKLVRSEPANSPFLTGGQLTLELQDLQRP